MRNLVVYFSLLFLGIVTISHNALSQNERQKATQVVMGRITDSESNSPLGGVKLTVVLDTTKLNLYGNENENTIVDYSKGIVGTSFESNLSDNTFMKLTLGVSATDENFIGDSIDVNTRKEYRKGLGAFETQKYSFVGQLRHKFDAQYSISSGFNIDRTNFTLNRKEYYDSAKVARRES